MAGAVEWGAVPLGSSGSRLLMVSRRHRISHQLEAFDCPTGGQCRRDEVRVCLPLAWLIVLFFAPATGAAAQPPASMDGRETRITGSVGTAHYSADERQSNGDLLNHEEGNLWRTTLGLQHAAGPWLVRGDFRESRGTLDYTGRTQLGLPLLTTTALSHRDLEVAAGYRWPLAGTSSVAVIAGVEVLRTFRDIRATAFTTALTETLTSRRGALGSRAQTAVTVAGRPLRLAVSVDATRPWSQDLSVDTHGLTDALVLHPRPRWGRRVDFEAMWQVAGSIALGVSAGQEVLRIGSAPSVTAYRSGLPVGSASYPGTVQRLGHISGTFGWRF